MVLFYLFGSYLILYPDQYTRYALQVIEVPNDFWRLHLLGFCVIHLLVSFSFEYAMTIIEMKVKKYLNKIPSHEIVENKRF
jgi:hypothetical protein